jgi:hypothetical protein
MFKALVVTIARFRKHIEKYYNIAEIGKFPMRKKPINIYAEIDINNDFLSLGYINKIIKNLHLSNYSPLKYLLPEKHREYSVKYDILVKDGRSIFRQTAREQALMRVNILKRLESSINSFGIIIARLLKRIIGSINDYGFCS